MGRGGERYPQPGVPIEGPRKGTGLTGDAERPGHGVEIQEIGHRAARQRVSTRDAAHIPWRRLLIPAVRAVVAVALFFCYLHVSWTRAERLLQC